MVLPGCRFVCAIAADAGEGSSVSRASTAANATMNPKAHSIASRRIGKARTCRSRGAADTGLLPDLTVLPFLPVLPFLRVLSVLAVFAVLVVRRRTAHRG